MGNYSPISSTEFFRDIEAPPPPPDRPKKKFLSWDLILPSQPDQKIELAPPLLQHIHPATNDKNLRKRAESKDKSDALARELIGLNSPLKYKYKQQLECSKTLIRKGKKFTSSYCNCKTCLVCNNIRTGRLTNKYLLLSEYLQDSQFVTLTVRNIYRYQYDSDIEFVDAIKALQKEMYFFFRKVQDRFRKQSIPIKGIRAYECIVSKDGKGVHPHIHWQIDGTFDIADFTAMWTKEKFNEHEARMLVRRFNEGHISAGYLKGRLIINLWMKEFAGRTDIQAQQVMKCTAGTERELFKYTTKIFTKIDGVRIVPIRMIDIIMQASQHVKAITITGFLTKNPPPDYLKYEGAKRKIEFEKFAAKGKEVILYKTLTRALIADENFI